MDLKTAARMPLDVRKQLSGFGNLSAQSCENAEATAERFSGVLLLEFAALNVMYRAVLPNA